jgi:hypothetical protein
MRKQMENKLILDVSMEVTFIKKDLSNLEVGMKIINNNLGRIRTITKIDLISKIVCCDYDGMDFVYEDKDDNYYSLVNYYIINRICK